MPPRPTAPRRFRDTGARLHDFTGECLVVCPKCSLCATIRIIAAEADQRPRARRVSCPHCGMIKEHSGDPSTSSAAGAEIRDLHFDLPLWLQAPCCNETLWACNPQHLQFLKDYLSATLRERRRDPKAGWTNGSLPSRLPRWMQLAKNRTSALHGLKKLEERLQEVG